MHLSEKIKIVFVDDDQFFANILSQRYQKYPVEFIHIHSVEEFENKKSLFNAINLSITDYSLGKYEGGELVKLLKDNGLNKVVVFSGYGHNELKVKDCLEAGAEEFVDKSDITRIDKIIDELCTFKTAANS